MDSDAFEYFKKFTVGLCHTKRHLERSVRRTVSKRIVQVTLLNILVSLKFNIFFIQTLFLRNLIQKGMGRLWTLGGGGGGAYRTGKRLAIKCRSQYVSRWETRCARASGYRFPSSLVGRKVPVSQTTAFLCQSINSASVCTRWIYLLSLWTKFYPQTQTTA